MADEDAEIAVTIEPDDAPIGDAPPAKIEPSPPAKQSAIDPVADLKGQYEALQTSAARDRAEREAATQRAEQAERARVAAERQAADARGQAVESQYDTIVSGLDAAKAEAEASEREYKAAYDAGDGAAMAAAQRKMARAEATSVRLDEAKSAMEAAAKRIPERREAPIEAPQGPAAADPVEAYIAGRTEQTQRWLREHKEFITDRSKNAKLTAAHFNAVGDGLQPDTDAYFEHVEKFIGLRDTAPVKAAAPRKSPTPSVAPVGSPSGGGVNGGTTVTLKAFEAKAATDGTLTWNYPDPTGKGRWKKGDPIGVQEFARRKSEMMKEGRYDKANYDA